MKMVIRWTKNNTGDTFGYTQICQTYTTNNTVYFNHSSDFKVAQSLEDDQVGFLFITQEAFQEYVHDIVLRNNQEVIKKFNLICGTYVFDNRIVIITSKYFTDIDTLYTYSRKLRLSPFELNCYSSSPYKLMYNFIIHELQNIKIPTNNKHHISGGLIKCNEPNSFHHVLYEYDITACYPNIIMNYVEDTEPIKILMKHFIQDNIKDFKLWLYGFLGNQFTILYNPRLMDQIATTTRTILQQYIHRAVIIATDSIFMKTEIVPNFFNLRYKSKIHTNVFVVNASMYITDDTYKGLPKNKLSDIVYAQLKILLNSTHIYKTTGLALIHFMSTITEFPVLPIPLKNNTTVTLLIQNNDVIAEMIDKYRYLYCYRKIIYLICNHKSQYKIPYDTFKLLYKIFIYNNE